ncbi:segregation and condensation protein A [Streptomyces sp. NPDC048508]|uniref:segregation and condensation protein A n=1 Tax=Streptomyces sp. NPDC048508 TaxID=3365561 RepID=UPI0037182BD9
MRPAGLPEALQGPAEAAEALPGFAGAVGSDSSADASDVETEPFVRPAGSAPESGDGPVAVAARTAVPPASSAPATPPPRAPGDAPAVPGRTGTAGSGSPVTAPGGAGTAGADVSGTAAATDGADAVGPVEPDQPVDDGVFKVRLSNFEGPFDLLLQLISKHKLDVTEVALSKVTDEFMAHIRAMGPDWDLDQTTEFLVVAATLLDLKAARLLPTAEVEDEGDLALLEARDLLFARLLQYRAYKQIADIFNARLEEEGRRYPRTVGLEAHHAALLPEVVISIGPEGFARLAVKAMQPRPRPQVYVDHIHAPLVSVQEQAGIVVARLRELGEASFRALVEDTDDTLTVVARFLALLELYREKAVALDQEEALGDLMVRWTGGEGEDRPRVTDEFDRPPEPLDDGNRRAGGKPGEAEEEKA